MAEGLKSADKALLDLRRILEQSFGPYGKDVLMKSDTGILYLSKDGAFIMKHLEIKHPVANLIKRTVNNFEDSIGDFSKSFIILLSHLIHRLNTKYVENLSFSNVDQLNEQLSQLSIALLKIKEQMLPGMFIGECLNKICIRVPDISAFTKNYLLGVLEASLSGKLNSQSKRIFFDIINDIVNDKNFSFLTLKHLIDDFENVCISINGIPLNCSKLLQGIIIQRECFPRDVQLENVRFILIVDKLTRTDSVEQQFVGSTSLINHQNAESRFYEKFACHLKKLNVSVIFTEEVIPKKLEYVLMAASIALVMYVPNEDVERLSCQYNINVLSGLYEIFNVRSVDKHVIGCSSFIKSTVVGKKYSCHIGPNVNIDASIQRLNLQILLCNISEGLGIQYKRVLLNTLKILYQTWNEKTFEIMLFPSCCSVEVYMSKIFHQLSKRLSCQTEMEVAVMLSESFLEIPKLIFENSNKKTIKRFLLGLQKEEDIKCMMDLDINFGISGETGDVVDATTLNLYEPMSSKIKLILTLLELSAQIVRIQHVIPVDSKIKTDSEHDFDE